MGVDPAIRRQTSEPFFTTRKAGKDKGLVPSNGYGIIKQSDGYIIRLRVKSVAERVLKFTYPEKTRRRKSSNRAKNIESGEKHRGGRKREFLLAEDKEIVRDRAVLESNGYQVIATAN